MKYVALIILLPLLLLSCQEEDFTTKILDMNINDGKPCPRFFTVNKETGRCNRDMHVFGQDDFHGIYRHAGEPNASGLYRPYDMVKIGTKVAISDTSNNRVLIFDSDTATVASVVLGQPDMTSGKQNQGLDAPTASTLYYPYNLATDGTRLIVADRNHRVLIWNTVPTTNGQPADLVLGQPDFVSGDGNRGAGSDSAAANSMYYPKGVLVIGTKLYVADSSNHRILVWNTFPTENGQAADYVIGQENFTSRESNRDSTTSSITLSSPYGLHSDGTKLVVADAANSRVLIWNTIPTTINEGADVVVGQTAMDQNSYGNGANQLMYPFGARIIGTSLYVVDYFNRRIQYFATIPAADNASADSTLYSYSSPPAANKIYSPSNIYDDGTAFYIVDSAYYRVMKFNTIPTVAGTSADSVIGQVDLDHADPNGQGPNAKGFNNVSNIGTTDQYLIVSSRYDSRLMVFDKYKPGEDAIAVIGQADFTTGNSLGYNNNPGCPVASASNLCNAEYSYVSSSGKVYIASRYQHRVLVYNSVPTTNGVDADYVIGQPNFTTTTATIGSNGKNGLSNPMGIVECGGYLWINDYGNKRVLRYDLPISSNQPDANLVIGQPDFFTLQAAETAINRFKSNMGISCDEENGRLFIIEHTPARVVIFEPLPTSNYPDATYVLGQPTMTSTLSETSRTIISSSNYNTGFMVDGHFFVGDRGSNRVLGWDLSGTITNGMPAKFLFGQEDFTTNEWGVVSDYKYGTPRISGPQSIWIDYDEEFVWIGESGGNRVIRMKREIFWKYLKR